MTILVTGGAGFVGNNIIDKLVAKGHTVRAMVHSLEKAQNASANMATRSKSCRVM